MKSYEKDFVYYLIREDEYLEKAYRVFFDAYSHDQALNYLASYIKSQLDVLLNNLMYISSSVDLLLFFTHLEDELNYREMAIFVVDFYK